MKLFWSRSRGYAEWSVLKVRPYSLGTTPNSPRLACLPARIRRIAHVKATISEHGEVLIPAQPRREMDLRPGRTVVFEKVSETEGRLIVEPERVVEADPFQAIGFARRHGLPAMTTAEWMNLLREGGEG